MLLPYEVKIGGFVQYKWMYPFERYMLYLKRKVQNKIKVEGSICETYILEELSFSSTTCISQKDTPTWSSNHSLTKEMYN